MITSEVPVVARVPVQLPAPLVKEHARETAPSVATAGGARLAPGLAPTVAGASGAASRAGATPKPTIAISTTAMVHHVFERPAVMIGCFVARPSWL